MGIQNPSLNRKLLGTWAVAVSGGQTVAAVQRAAGEQADAYEGCVCGDADVPAVLEIRRDGPRQTKKHRYGVIDLHLAAGEALRLSVRASAAADAPQVRIGLNYSFGTKNNFT